MLEHQVAYRRGKMCPRHAEGMAMIVSGKMQRAVGCRHGLWEAICGKMAESASGFQALCIGFGYSISFHLVC